MCLNIFSTWDINLANNGGSFQFERGSTTWKIFVFREKVNTIKTWEIEKGKTALRKNLYFFRWHVVFIEKVYFFSRLFCTWTWWWLWGWPCSSTPTSPSTPSHRTRYRCSTRQPGISPRSDNTIREFSSQLKNNQRAIAQTIKSKRPDPDFRVMTCCVIHDGERNYGHFKCGSSKGRNIKQNTDVMQKISEAKTAI